MIFLECKGTLSKIRGGFMENKVEELRKNMGLNQEEFAKKIRVSRQTVSSIETGKYNPSLDLAFLIADFFDKTIEEIFVYERSENNEKK
jgi:putative transcriptional regulator